MEIASGTRYGMLTVIGMERRERDCRPMWRCLCDCGRETLASGNQIESRAFFRQTILAHQRVSAFNHDLCFVITHRGPLQGPQVKKIARPTEVFLADWEGVVLVRDGKVYNYDD